MIFHFFKFDIFFLSLSIPKTFIPLFLNLKNNGKPTYPRPTTTTENFFNLIFLVIFYASVYKNWLFNNTFNNK